jgi:hypothetical protein
MILHTGIALGVTLVVLAGALAILQYREKVCFLVFLLENFQTSLCYRLKMIVNVKFKHKHFIMMLYDLFLFFLIGLEQYSIEWSNMFLRLLLYF